LADWQEGIDGNWQRVGSRDKTCSDGPMLRSIEEEMEAECVVSVEIILVKSFVADEAEVLIQSQRCRVVDFCFQYDLLIIHMHQHIHNHLQCPTQF